MARIQYGLLLGMVLFAGCSESVDLGGTGASSSIGTTTGTPGSSISGATSSGGTTTGGSVTAGSTATGGATSTGGKATGGTTTGALLAAGHVCTGDGQCSSGVCGVNGSGNCCSAACSADDTTCGATACDPTGACTYPIAATSCGTSSCTGNQLTTSACDGSGKCAPQAPAACDGNLQCQDATTCDTTCASSTDCVSGFYCNAGTCLATQTNGPCGSNDACTSGICGISGSGDCCTAACAPAADPACDATDCDATTGDCTYALGKQCGASCTGSTLTAGACDATGACGAAIVGACPGNLLCNAGGTDCLASCSLSSDCVSGSYCNNGSCASQVAVGAVCTSNDACTTAICGATGIGHCCTATCLTTDPSCGATDCDATGACVYPLSSASCGTLSCSGTTQTDTSTCDGAGTCLPAGTQDCTPYACGATACLPSCSSNKDCAAQYFCDDDTLGNAVCCTGLLNGGTVAVDSTIGSNQTACCGYGGAGPCQTITHAMALIASAGAVGVTINATVNGAGGDWRTEPSYPVVLGWGVELSAPGVYFLDTNEIANPAIFDIKEVGSDTTGYASLVGSATDPISVGFSSTGVQTAAMQTIQVEAGETLYIANASVNGDAAMPSGSETFAAIDLEGSASLVLGEDQPGLVTGTVNIGNALGANASDGLVGIFCNPNFTAATGCTISDVNLDGGSSVVFQGQEAFDLYAGQYGNVTLSANPVFGVPPSGAGTGQCPFAKTDGVGLFGVGPSTISITNATFQCIDGYGIVTESDHAAPPIAGAPTITLDHSTIQNCGTGIYTQTGTVTVTNTTIQYNANGVWQDLDLNNNNLNSFIDLSGGQNSVVCSSDVEASSMTTLPAPPGVGVYNTSTANLKADNVAWDTVGPDYFACDTTLTICACNLASCTVAAGADDMDAVEDSTNLGGITTTNNTVSPITCN